MRIRPLWYVCVGPRLLSLLSNCQFRSKLEPCPGGLGVLAERVVCCLWLELLLQWTCQRFRQLWDLLEHILGHHSTPVTLHTQLAMSSGTALRVLPPLGLMLLLVAEGVNRLVHGTANWPYETLLASQHALVWHVLALNRGHWHFKGVHGHCVLRVWVVHQLLNGLFLVALVRLEVTGLFLVVRAIFNWWQMIE